MPAAFSPQGTHPQYSVSYFANALDDVFERLHDLMKEANVPAGTQGSLTNSQVKASHVFF